MSERGKRNCKSAAELVSLFYLHCRAESYIMNPSFTGNQEESEGIRMMKFQSEKGEVSVSNAVFSNITGMAATNCFGVKGMAYRSMTDGLVHLLRREAMNKGVRLSYHEDGSVSIELHIVVENGVNIPAVCRSIMNEVQYVVGKHTGAEVRSVDVYVDSMTL